MISNEIWKTKLAAWLHDPAEKALILLRDKTGHEWGTVAKLRGELGIGYEEFLKQADWYASAADRPQFPQEDNSNRYAAWTQVDFAKAPVLVHPLTGDSIEIPGKLEDIGIDQIKSVSEDHFRSLIIRDVNGQPDHKRTLLSFWRFGPESPAPDLDHLWQNLPADTRVPDHSIWTHLDLVSAFSGAMSADAQGTPALMAVSFGPVQSFIAEARSTSDLWAGSHLLARIAWEGLKVICERLGPDAILFPNLRGTPVVDVWLRDEMGLPRQKFADREWVKWKSDANPLFAAVLPNRFVALVPFDRVETLANEITQRVREFVLDLGNQVIHKILTAIGQQAEDTFHCFAQMKEQLSDFPEVYWAAVPWSLGGTGNRLDPDKLRSALGNFYPENASTGFLDSPAWQLLQREITLDGAKFYIPNPGVLYPALYDLLDRVSAAAKTARQFKQLPQVGYRSSLNGEREWLTLEKTQLDTPPGERIDTLWSRLADRRPTWVRKGEHLDGLNTIKRLWPTLFSEWVADVVGEKVNRYVVSTHTLALAVSMDKWLDARTSIPMTLRNLLESTESDRTALPRQLFRKVVNNEDAKLICTKLPSVLDFLKVRDDTQSREFLASAERDIHELFGEKEEAYFGMILLDGDRMGAWLAGNEPQYQTEYCQSWHPHIVNNVKQRFGSDRTLEHYLAEKRWPSPARHAAISLALNNFSLKIALFVVEECFKGKLVYAGGDDVLAFVCVDELLPAMVLLRCLYSGISVPKWITDRLGTRISARFKSEKGYVLLDGRLLLTLGEKAHASCGAIVAHHQAPLAHVLRQLRSAESIAKSPDGGGRNAFALRIIKRAGGEIGVTDQWIRENDHRNAPELLSNLSELFSRENVSRRAAYHSDNWLAQLPRNAGVDLLKCNLAHQFKRQGTGRDGVDLAYELAHYATAHHSENAIHWLRNILMTAEFLARESRFRAIGNSKREDAA